MAVLVSVLLPAYQAQATILAAVQSIYAAGLPSDQFEILVESDDGDDYAQLAALPSVKISCSGVVKSGVGPARNRALLRSNGRYITYLDADDIWEDGYLSSLLPLMQRSAAAAAPLKVQEEEEVILSLWQELAVLTRADMAKSGASARGLFAREVFMPFENLPSQDIFHTVKVIEACGGAMPLSKVAYLLRLRAQSVTQDRDFAQKVHQAYLAYVKIAKRPREHRGLSSEN